MSAKKTKVRSEVSVNAYVVVARAVEEGVNYGYNRAHKHTDEPSAEQLKQAIEDSVLLHLTEVLNFGE